MSWFRGYRRVSILMSMLCLLSFSVELFSAEYSNQLALPRADIFAPEIEHQAPNISGFESEGLQIKAKVKDNVGVRSVVLYYRTIGESGYRQIRLLNTQGDQYAVTISPADISTPGIEYYLQAEDQAGNTLLHGHTFSPLIVKLETAPVVGKDGLEIASTSNIGKPQSQENNATPLWKNKWLWIGVGVLAAAAISSGGSDDGGSMPSSGAGSEPTPGTSVTIGVGGPDQF